MMFRMVSHIVCCTAHYSFLWAGGSLVFAADVFISSWGKTSATSTNRFVALQQGAQIYSLSEVNFGIQLLGVLMFGQLPTFHFHV